MTTILKLLAIIILLPIALYCLALMVLFWVALMGGVV